MNCRCVGRVLLAGVIAGLASVAMTSGAVAAPPPPITACTITVDNPVIYQSVADGPVSANFMIDTSGSVLPNGSYYIWAVGSGSSGVDYMFPIQQFASPNAFIPRSHNQLMGDWTNNTLLQIAEPYTGTYLVTSDTNKSTVKCQVQVTAAPNLAPSAPTDVTAAAGDAQATVSWTAWKSFTGQTYTVTAAPGGQTCTATHPSTSCTVTGLTNGTAYTFSVTNKTSGGTSSASAASSSVTPTAATTTTTVAATTTTIAGSGGSGNDDESAGDDEDLATATAGGALPDTGADQSGLLAAMTTAMVVGAMFVLLGRRFRRVA